MKRSPRSGLPVPENRISLPADINAEAPYVLPWAGFDSALTLTFDDAQPSHAAHLDALTATGVPMTFFVNANVAFPGSDSAWKRAVAAGHELGNHTASHPHLAPGNRMGEGVFGKAGEDPAGELERCDRFIRETAGQKGVWTFASPYGDTEWEPVAARRYPLVRSVAEGTVAPGRGNDPSHLPCHMAMPGETAAGRFIPLVDEARSDGEWLIFCFHSILPTEENWFAGIGIDEITATARHALRSGDVWADTFARIGAYWLARNAFESAKSSVRGKTRSWSWKVPGGFPEGTWLRAVPGRGTLVQGGEELPLAQGGYAEFSFDAGELSFRPE